MLRNKKSIYLYLSEGNAEVQPSTNKTKVIKKGVNKLLMPFFLNCKTFDIRIEGNKPNNDKSI